MYVDTLARKLSEFPAGIVSAGGDIRSWGKPPVEERWTVGLEHPICPGTDLLDISIADGAIATSGTNRRSWQRGTDLVHHLINPHTGLPAASPAQSITVVAATAEVADVLATVFFIAGIAETIDLSHLHPLFRLAISVTEGGDINMSEGGLELDVSIH